MPLPSQQPAGQLVALQLQPFVPSQYWPAAHEGPAPQPQPPSLAHWFASSGSQVTHAAPDVPQPASVRHAPLRQQPPAHDAGEHPVHAPPSQLCPEGQLWQLAPRAPQAAGVVPALQPASDRQHPLWQLMASQTQTVPTQRVPAAQAGALPH